MHRDIVPFCTPRVESLGHSSLCTTQIFYVEGRLISVQGHPEYNGNICREFLEQRRGTVLDETTYLSGKQRENIAHDGIAIATAFMELLLEH